jgi:hypothetical protein
MNRTARNFYFGRGADVVAGSANFAARIAEDYAAYGLSQAQAESYAVLDAALQEAFARATDPSTRTSVAVATKTRALREMRADAVRLAACVYADAAVTDAQLLGLGLSPRPVRRRRVGPPTAAPTIVVGLCRGRVVDVRLRPSDAGRRGLEFGARGAYLYTFVGDAPPADSRDWRFARLTTRAITHIEFGNDVPSGATGWLSARWVNARGQTGPAGAPAPVTIQGGAVLPRIAAA